MTAAATAAMMVGTAAAAAAAPTRPAAPAARVAHTAAARLTAPDQPDPLSWPLTVQGNTGERVVALQYLLNQQIGAGLATDGVFGPLTASAVRTFQARHGLLVDGKVGNQTWPVVIITVRQGNSGPAVSAVQHQLRFAYGYSLAVDGIFGPVTNSTVRAFQARFHIGVDGIVGQVTWNTLLIHES
jgi:peptidoglycan hydrolase-like protein with peptidoglycan-binding domain